MGMHFDRFLDWWLKQDFWRYLWVPVAISIAMTEVIVCALNLLMLGRIDGGYLLAGLVCAGLVSLAVSAALFLLSEHARQSAESGRRRQESLKRLNEIAALAHLPLAEQLQQALAAGARHFGLEFGIVSRIAGDTYHVVAQVSPPGTLHDGQEFPFGDTCCSITIGSGDIVAIPDMGASPYLGHPCYREFRPATYIGAPVLLEGTVFGTVNFSSPRPYRRQFDDGDREFLALLARWIGSALERDRAHQQLAASERQLQAIIETEPECVKVLAPDGTLRQMNRAGLDMIEADSIDQVAGKGILGIVAPRHREAFAALNERVNRGEPGILEFEIIGLKGHRRWLETHAVPLRDGAGAITGLLGVTRDISERKRHELDLRNAKEAAEAASRAKSEFLANMSHEVRTPMNGVIGMTHLLEQTRLTEEQKEYADAIRASAKALLTVINDILDFSKIEAGKLSVERVTFQPAAIVQELVDLFRPLAEDRQLALGHSIAADVPAWVSGDPTRLRQVLNNLLGNAVKFTEQGEVALALTREADDADGAVRLRFAVRDTGIGIRPEALAKLFTPFFQADASTTRRYGGTGLGLSISQRLAGLMGGRIAVASAPGAGSTFQLVLPFSPAAAPEQPQDAAAAEQPHFDRHAHVLVVEDSAINQKVAMQMLAKLDVRVTAAADGAEAIDILRRRHFDLVLLDCQMPVMDGYETARRIRAGEADAANAGIRIVAMTANAMPGDREKCLGAGMDDYLAKPMSFDELAAKLARWLPAIACDYRSHSKIQSSSPAE